MSDIAKKKIILPTPRMIMERNWLFNRGIEDGNQTPRGLKREEMESGWGGPPSADGWRYKDVMPGERIRRIKDTQKGVK